MRQHQIAAFLLGAAAAVAQSPPGFDEALARYQTVMQRKPFAHHLEGREKLAGTKAAAAWPLLAKDYEKPPDYLEYSRYTLAALIGRHFDRAEFVEPMVQLREQCTKGVDAWLWFHSLRIQADRGGAAAVEQIAIEGKSVMQRAAAILALGSARQANLAPAVLANVLNFPKKESERMLLLGAMTGAFWESRLRVNETSYREALKAYISLLEPDVKLSHTACVQIGRHLHKILGGPAMFVNPEPWLALLDRGEVKKPTSQQTSAQPRFFGIETDGERLIYLLDMSDSMCKKIEPSAKPSGPITGPKQKKPRALLDESDLPWHKIATRWDLAREQLKISLLRLTPEKYFSVVWFGTDSGTLESTKGMVKATKTNVDRAVAELDAIKPGDPDANKAPDGQLRGRTNLHSGLTKAFGLAGKGFVEQVAYVDADAITEGCDTIFLLSDGAPSWDDFHCLDKDYGEGEVVLDTEYGKKMPRTPTLEYHGPYVHDDWLVEDLRRMNSFRRIRLHCIGLGEANMALLKRLAEIGHGETFLVGEKKGK